MQDDDYVYYGIVKIIEGEYKGRFAYYDDSDIDEDEVDYDLLDNMTEEEQEEYYSKIKQKALVYFGNAFYCREYILIDHDCLTNTYTIHDLQERNTEIISELILQKDLSYEERLFLMEEKNLIDLEINNLYEEYMDNKKLNNIKVFLSHSSLDKSKVISIAVDLKQRGVNSWLDAFDILPGESIVSKINEGLDECKYILLFLSKNSVNSKWVEKEWQSALWNEIDSNKIKIIPIKLEDCEIPSLLKTKKYIDFSKDYNRGLYELIHALKEYNEREKVK